MAVHDIAATVLPAMRRSVYVTSSTHSLCTRTIAHWRLRVPAALRSSVVAACTSSLMARRVAREMSMSVCVRPLGYPSSSTPACQQCNQQKHGNIHAEEFMYARQAPCCRYAFCRECMLNQQNKAAAPETQAEASIVDAVTPKSCKTLKLWRSGASIPVPRAC